MINISLLLQIFFYDFVLLRYNNFTLSINGLFVLIVLFTSIYFKRYKYAKYITKLSYMVILIHFCNLFNFINGSLDFIDISLSNKIIYFLYTMINYPIPSLTTYFVIYTILNITLMLGFSFIFKERYFIVFIIIYLLSRIIMFQLGFNGLNISLYDVVLYIIGFVVGKHFKDMNRTKL